MQRNCEKHLTIKLAKWKIGTNLSCRRACCQTRMSSIVLSQSSSSSMDFVTQLERKDRNEHSEKPVVTKRRTFTWSHYQIEEESSGRHIAIGNCKLLLRGIPCAHSFCSVRRWLILGAKKNFCCALLCCVTKEKSCSSMLISFQFSRFKQLILEAFS